MAEPIADVLEFLKLLIKDKESARRNHDFNEACGVMADAVRSYGGEVLEEPAKFIEHLAAPTAADDAFGSHDFSEACQVMIDAIEQHKPAS